MNGLELKLHMGLGLVGTRALTRARGSEVMRRKLHENGGNSTNSVLDPTFVRKFLLDVDHFKTVLNFFRLWMVLNP